jgi:ATP-dependent helicase HepA
LLECLYSLEAASVEALQTERYLPPTMIRVVVDEKGVDHNNKLPHRVITTSCAQVDFETANKIVRAKQKILKLLVDRCEKMAHLQVPAVLDEAHQQASETLTREINRLKALSRVNPNVRAEEIHFFEQQLERLTRVLDSATLRLDALRVIVAT